MKPNTSDHKHTWENNSDEQKQKAENCLKVEECLIISQDIYCNDSSHTQASDDFIINILETIDQSYTTWISRPSTIRKGKDLPIAPWTSEVEPFKKDAHFWHYVWVLAGKPLHILLHGIMKRTWNIYHLQVRKCENMISIEKEHAPKCMC